MKNLLIIAYYFPPSGGPGVQRVLKHIEYLPDFGWNPLVFTVENGQFPARDESLMKKIPESVKVFRSHIFEPYDIYRFLTGKQKGTAIDVNTIKKESQKLGIKEKLAEFIRASFFIPDARMAWIFSSSEMLQDIIEKEKIDAIYSSSPPYTCSIMARNLKRKTGLPWVAGFRDPWTEFISSPKRWFLPAALDRKMEGSVFRESDVVECAWEGIIKDALKKYPELDLSKFHHVPNGFDSSDFPKIENKRNKRFTVTYSGSLYGRRNPASFFAAVEMLIKDNKIDKDRVLIRFIGRFGSEVEEMMDMVSFPESLERISYIPHEESIKKLMESDCLLLIVDESKESGEIVPGKVFEYIGVMKPVIAIAPHNSAIERLLAETGSGKAAHQSEIERTAEIILELYENWKTGNELFFPDKEAINKYERRQSAGKLAELLDTAIAENASRK